MIDWIKIDENTRLKNTFSYVVIDIDRIIFNAYAGGEVAVFINSMDLKETYCYITEFTHYAEINYPE